MTDENHVETFRHYLLDEQGLRPNTAKLYFRAVEYLFRIVQKPYTDLTLDDLILFKQEIKKGMESSMKPYKQVKAYDSNSLTPFYCGVQSYVDFLATPPQKKSTRKQVCITYHRNFFKPPKWDKKRSIKKHLRQKEIQVLFESIKHDPRATAIVHLFFSTCGRVSEINRINIESFHKGVNEEGKEIYTVDLWLQKTQETDTRRITKPCYEALQEYLKVRHTYLPEKPEKIKKGDENALFLGISGQRLTKGRIWQIIKECGVTAKLGRLTPHMLRHSGATFLALQGFTALEIASHTKQSILTVQGYVHLAEEEGISDRITDALTLNKPTAETPKAEIVVKSEMDKLLELERLKAENLKLELEITKAKQKQKDPETPLYG
jgi:site-specific recombinase XerD